MEFGFSEKEIAFREEVRHFLQAELPPGWHGEIENDTYEAFPFSRGFTRKLAARGWLALAWPQEYGGQARSHLEQVVYNEELAYYRAPSDIPSLMAVTWVGPALILYGTEEQKKAYLPRIASGEIGFCTLYSEPAAGSDLASLQCRAERQGDEYVINGQKVWTSGGHLADYGWLAARTDPAAPKHKGISAFVVDMKAPGVTVRPLLNIVGAHSFNEVFFDNVRLPRTNLVGEENRGWYIIAVALDFERTGVSVFAGGRRTLEELVEYAQEKGRDRNPIIRYKLADRAIEIAAGRLMAYRIASWLSQGRPVNYEAAMAKCYGAELNQRLFNTGMEVLGLYGQVAKDSKWAALEGYIHRGYLRAVGNTIEAGTSEINRHVIATRGLGLPR